LRTWPTKRRRIGGRSLEAFADRGYFKGEEILACEEVGITVMLPKPQTSDAKSEGRFGKQDFRYLAEEDIYICPAGEKLAHHFTNEENGLVLRRYWTNACRTCALKAQCTKGPQRRITRGRPSTLSMPCRRAWTKIRMRCVLDARRSSIRLAR